jgi:hypothetical protein
MTGHPTNIADTLADLQASRVPEDPLKKDRRSNRLPCQELDVPGKSTILSSFFIFAHESPIRASETRDQTLVHVRQHLWSASLEKPDKQKTGHH